MKYSILFMVDDRSKLRMVVRYKMKRMTYSLGFSVDKGKWNKESQRCKRATTHGKKGTPAAKINAVIQAYEDNVTRVAEAYTKDPTPEAFKAAMDEALGRIEAESEGDKFFSVYDTFVKEASRNAEWTKATFTKMETAKRHLFEFDEKLTFGKVSLEWMEELCNFYSSKNYKSSYVKKMMATTKTFLLWAHSKGYITDSSFTGYRCRVKTVQKRVIFLTWEELMKVYHFDFGQKFYLSRVRDCFCFSCFTSLRYSDVANLKKDDITNGVIHITTKKTHDSLSIELNDYSRAILDKYKLLDSEYALPTISNVKMNEYLKEMGKVCGLNEPITETYYRGGKRVDTCSKKWELLTTHCGRRTFICNALMMGIQPNVVMKWTGHSDYKSMRPYIDIADDVKASAMSLFNKK